MSLSGVEWRGTASDGVGWHLLDVVVGRDTPGEPAIRRAIREDRIRLAFQLVIGGRDAITFLNLAQVVAAYGMMEAIAKRIKEWTKHAPMPIFRSPDGREWLV